MGLAAGTVALAVVVVAAAPLEGAAAVVVTVATGVSVAFDWANAAIDMRQGEYGYAAIDAVSGVLDGGPGLALHVGKVAATYGAAHDLGKLAAEGDKMANAGEAAKTALEPSAGRRLAAEGTIAAHHYDPMLFPESVPSGYQAKLQDMNVSLSY